MLTSFSLPSKNLSQEKQMALMRNYLNQLKDETETELYDIKWDNLAKPLKDKINGLDKDIVATNDNLGQLQANTVTTKYLESEFVYAGNIEANQIQAGTFNAGVIYAGNINASQINAGKINTTVFNASMLEAEYVNASNQIKTSKLDATVVKATDITAYGGSFYYLSTGQLDAAYMSTDYLTVNGKIKTSELDATVIKTTDFTATNIATQFLSTNTAVFDRINLDQIPYSNSSSALRIAAGGSYANVYLKGTGVAHQYYLVVNMPD